MKLNKLITPTVIGKGYEQAQVPVRLLNHQDLEKYPFLKDLIFASREDVDYCWLANDTLYKENANSFKNYSDGCYSLRDKKHYPIERRIDEPWEDDVYRYIYNLSVKTRNNYEPSKCRFNSCLCMEIDVNAYLQLMKVDKSYFPFEIKNDYQKYHYVNLGEQFDVRTGQKGTQKITWCVLNPEILFKAMKLQETKKSGPCQKVLLCDLGNAGMSNFVFRCEELGYFKPGQENTIMRNLNGDGNQKNGFIESIFAKETALLRNVRSKKTTAIPTNVNALKKEFIKAMQTNPEALRELIPLMKEFIDTQENRTL